MIAKLRMYAASMDERLILDSNRVMQFPLPALGSRFRRFWREEKLPTRDAALNFLR
jgi:hypothetical protein